VFRVQGPVVIREVVDYMYTCLYACTYICRLSVVGYLGESVQDHTNKSSSYMYALELYTAICEQYPMIAIFEPTISLPS
jgi:hypothetical protein